MSSIVKSRNPFQSAARVLTCVLCAITAGAELVRADDGFGGAGLRIPGIIDLDVQWGEPQPINAPYVVQTRGPVHEAFAEPILYDPAPEFIIFRRPPEPLEEVPPQVYPVSSGLVTWIPGYWAWDEDRNSFLWVSGIWRNVPPGQQFVPGYWLQLTTGFCWVSGFWISDQAETVQYLPQPPQSLERGPTSVPSAADAVWVPGTWVWHEVGYLWRPGYWTRHQPGWVWVPDHYVWAPSGYISVHGYWDYSLQRRGLLFAPIYVATPVVAAPRFVYRPNVVVNVSVLISDLFARPRYCHYYFGDYYQRDYFRSGIYPAYAFYDSDFGYDPIFATYVAAQRVPRSEVLQRFRGEYRHLRDNPNLRPPRTYRGFEQLATRRDLDPRLASRASLVQPLRQFAERPQPDLPFRFERLEPDRLSRYRETIAQTRQYRQERERLEGQNLRDTPQGQALSPARPTPTPGRDRPMDTGRPRTPVPDPGRLERTVPDREEPAGPAQPARPSIQRDRETPAMRAPDSTSTPRSPGASPSIRREQLPEETQSRVRRERADLEAATGKPSTEARPAPPGRAGTGKSIERGRGDPLQLRLNRSPLGGRAATHQPNASVSRGDQSRRQEVAPPAPKGVQPDKKARSDRPVRERRAPKED